MFTFVYDLITKVQSIWMHFVWTWPCHIYQQHEKVCRSNQPPRSTQPGHPSVGRPKWVYWRWPFRHYQGRKRRVLRDSRDTGSKLKVEKNFFTVPPLVCSAPQLEGALLTPGWAQRCAIILFVRKEERETDTGKELAGRELHVPMMNLRSTSVRALTNNHNIIGRRTGSRSVRRVTTMVFIVTVVFVVCWTPYHVMNFVQVHHHQKLVSLLSRANSTGVCAVSDSLPKTIVMLSKSLRQMS